MTKKDYQKIANALACGNYRIDLGGGEGAGYNAAIRLIIDCLQQDNPNFSQFRFAEVVYAGTEDCKAICSEFDI